MERALAACNRLHGGRAGDAPSLGCSELGACGCRWAAATLRPRACPLQSDSVVLTGSEDGKRSSGDRAHQAKLKDSSMVCQWRRT